MMKKIGNTIATMVLTFGLATSAYAEETKLLVLDYDIYAANAKEVSKDFSQSLLQNLKEEGYSVQASQKTSANMSVEEARRLAQIAGADYVLYGSLNQLGNAVALETKIVDASSDMSRIEYAQGDDINKLDSVVAGIVAELDSQLIRKDGIVDIRVDGLQAIDENRILVNLESKVGTEPNIDILNEDLHTVWNMGYFSDVDIFLEASDTGRGDILVVDVVEKPKILEVRISGSEELDEDDVIDAMTSRQGTVLNEKLLADDLQIIKELYRKKGYYLIDVDYVIERGGQNNAGAILLLTVDTGNKLYITDVNIAGVDEEMEEELHDIIKLKEKGFFSWFTKSGILNEENLEGDMQAIQGHLIGAGYLDAKVALPEVDYNETGITVNFDVHAGTRYKIGDVDFAGDLLEGKDVLTEVILLDNLKEEDAYFSVATMQDDVKKLTELYNDYGYAFASVDPRTNVDPEAGIINILFLMNPKEKVYIREVVLEGNVDTRDNVILRELRLADGQAYEGAKLRRSIERLNHLQYFDDVQADLLPTGIPGEADLKIAVKEADTGTISLGVGYSTYDSMGVSASISRRNLFGRGYQASVQGYLSGKSADMSFNFINPRIYDTKLGFIFSVYAKDDEWIDYDRDSLGTTVGLMYPLGEYSSVRATYTLETYDLYNVEEDASSTIKEYEGENVASVLGLTLSRNTTDHPLMPTRGTKQSLEFEYGGGILGGTDNYYKLTAKYGAYYGLNKSHVLHAKGTVGGIFENGDDTVPTFERFYIGGMNSMRGFSYEDLSPIDKKTGDSIGATRVAYGSLEYIWEADKDLGVYLIPFFDIGTSFDHEYDDWGDHVYYSSGLELRWNSPLGFLRFAYGIPLTKNVEDEDISGRFEFSMGNTF